MLKVFFGLISFLLETLCKVVAKNEAMKKKIILLTKDLIKEKQGASNQSQQLKLEGRNCGWLSSCRSAKDTTPTQVGMGLAEGKDEDKD